MSARVKWPILVFGLAVTSSLVYLLGSSFGSDPMVHEDVIAGRQAATFRLTDLDGKEWSLAELQGKPVVLNFWSSWCGPCKDEHPLLVAAPKMYPDVVFLGVIYSDKEDVIRRYLAMNGSSFPHLLDPTGRVAVDYGVGGVPETVFIDRTGHITYKQVGPLWPQALQAQIQRIQ